MYYFDKGSAFVVDTCKFHHGVKQFGTRSCPTHCVGPDLGPNFLEW